MEHTPGPWSYMQDGKEPYWSIGMNGKGPQHGHAMVYTNEDDARLVAAAPNLLAVCQEILQFMVPDDDDTGPATRLRRAVSKATGDGDD